MVHSSLLPSPSCETFWLPWTFIPSAGLASLILLCSAWSAIWFFAIAREAPFSLHPLAAFGIWLAAATSCLLFLCMLTAALAQALVHEQHCHCLHHRVDMVPGGGNKLSRVLVSVSQNMLFFIAGTATTPRSIWLHRCSHLALMFSGSLLQLPSQNMFLNSVSQLSSLSSFTSSTRGMPFISL
jgi:hypothetical protein